MPKVSVNAVTLGRVLQAVSPGVRFGVKEEVATLVREYNQQAGRKLLETAMVSKDALIAMLDALREHGLVGAGDDPVNELCAAVAA